MEVPSLIESSKRHLKEEPSVAHPGEIRNIGIESTVLTCYQIISNDFLTTG